MSTVKKISQKQEAKVAKDLNAKTVVASGALWGAKGDVRSDKYLVECKTTSKSFYSLTSSVWGKIKREAIKDGLRVPAMCIEVKEQSVAIVEQGLVQDYLTEHSIKMYSVDVLAKSFRVRADYDKPVAYNCTDKSWGKHPEKLVQMSWEDFVAIADDLI